MEILQPVEEKEETDTPARTDIPPELADMGVNLKNLEFMDYLEIKDDIFNPDIMEKIQFLAENIPDVDSLHSLDIRLGDDMQMSKLDKLYTYLKLNKEAERIREQEKIIREKINKYEQSS